MVLALAAGGCGDEGDDTGASGSQPDTTAPATTGTGTGSETGTAPGMDTTAGGCRAVDQPQPKPDGGAGKPKEKLSAKRTYTVTVETNCGEFAFVLDLKSAPETAASVVSLIDQDFYDDTIFHRIVPGFVIQGGDPTGTGSGGPGYSTVDKPPANAKYTKGVVAMAKTGTEPPGTAGSQFYVVTGEDAGLPAEYAVLGKVTRGLDVVERIGALGTPTETPSEVVVIEDMTVEES